MARRKSTDARKSLRSLISPQQLHLAGLNTGFIQRLRRFDPYAFLFALVFGFGVGGRRRLNALWMSYRGAAERSLSKTSFYEWISKPALAAWLRNIIEQVCAKLVDAGHPLAGPLAQFREVFTADSSTLPLMERLKAVFPGTRTNSTPAAAKLHVVRQVTGPGIRSVQVTDGRTHDLRAFQIGPWVRGALLLMDLGYFCFRHFTRIQRHGGFFVSRLKGRVNPTIVRSLRQHRGQKVPLEGQKLRDIEDRFRRKAIDVEVIVKPKGCSRQRLRLVGVWNELDRMYHLYLTNIRPDQLSAEHICETYRLRWEIELFFREAKGVHRLQELPGENPHIVEALILASILSALVTRRLVATLKARLAPILAARSRRILAEQGARVIQVAAPYLLHLVTAPRRYASAFAAIVDKMILDAASAVASPRLGLTDSYTNLAPSFASGTMTG